MGRMSRFLDKHHFKILAICFVFSLVGTCWVNRWSTRVKLKREQWELEDTVAKELRQAKDIQLVRTLAHVMTHEEIQNGEFDKAVTWFQLWTTNTYTFFDTNGNTIKLIRISLPKAYVFTNDIVRLVEIRTNN